MELTSTNRSIGLFDLITHARHGRTKCPAVAAPQDFGSSFRKEAAAFQCIHPSLVVICRLGDYCEEPKPDPIPNSAVKLLSADGTAS